MLLRRDRFLWKKRSFASSLSMHAAFRSHLYPYCLAILLFIILLWPGLLAAQQHPPLSYDVQHFTDENGLPQNSIKAIMADDEGFVWLSTESGLVRYDGQHFVTYDQSVLPLRSNRMGAFYLLPDTSSMGKKHFFTTSDHYNYLLIKDGRIVLDSMGFAKIKAGLPFSRVLQEQKAFISQSLPILYKITFDYFSHSIIPDQRGGYFVAGAQNISYYKGQEKLYDIPFQVSDLGSFFRIGTSLYWMDDNGGCKEMAGPQVCDIQLSGDILAHPAYRPGVRNFELYWSNTADQAFIYLQNSLYLLKKNAAGNLESRCILTGFDCKANNITTVYYNEKDRALYLGSINKGLFTFSPRQFTVLNVPGKDFDKDNIYYAQTAWEKDKVLTAQGHVLGLKTSYSLPGMKRSAGWDRYSMLVDRHGYIWTRSGDTINKFDRKGSRSVAKWLVPGSAPHLYEGRDGLLWVAVNKKGLYRLNPQDDTATLRPYLLFTLPDTYCMQEEGTSWLWVGTARGLYRVHLPGARMDTIKGLEQANIRSVYIPRPGEVWITTYGSGFFLYANQRLTRFPLDKGSYLAMAHCFVEDSLGFCWIPTNKGLFQASKKDLLNYAAGGQQQVFYLYHAREEGFNTNEFNGGCQPCAVQLPNGYISLPSLNGVVWFSPASLSTVLPDKKVFVDKLDVDQTLYSPKDTITLSREFNLMKLYCSTPYTGNGYNIQMQYAWVRGKEKPLWIPIGKDMIISQSSLAHGVWSLIIRKANGFGPDNYSYRYLTVIVPPAFYETWWFYGLLLILLIAFMWVYGRLRLQYIRKKNKQLEELVNNRTEELSKVLSSLSVSEQNIRRQLHIREILFTAISHDIGSPLKFMSMIAEELRDNLETANVPERIKKHADDIFKSGYYLYHLTRNLLQYLRISEQQADLQYRQFDLHFLVEDKTVIFQPIARERSVSVINQVPAPFYLYSDPHLLEVVIHNLLDNAVKATRKGSIIIRMALVNGQPHLVIEDSGHGIREEVAAYYNSERPAHEENLKPEGVYIGFGLHIVKELARLLQVKLHIETSDHGTAVHLIFPEASVNT